MEDSRYLNWHAVAEKFSCGRSKAMLLMHEVGIVYIGSEAFIKATDLDEHLAKYGEIKTKWPKKKLHRYERK